MVLHSCPQLHTHTHVFILQSVTAGNNRTSRHIFDSLIYYSQLIHTDRNKPHFQSQMKTNNKALQKHEENTVKVSETSQIKKES